MKNNRLDALLRRDESTQLGLEADEALYAPIEDDMVDLRAEHAQRLAAATELSDEVFEADGDDSAAVKKGTRGQLKTLAGRVGRALMAQAASKTNTDAELGERVQALLDELRGTDEKTFGQATTKILAEATPLAVALAKREVTAADLTSYTALQTKFDKRLKTGRMADVKGKTARLMMGDLLRANSKAIRKMREQLAPYKGTAREKALTNFDGYTKIVMRNNGSGGVNGGGTPTPPSA